MRWGEREFEYVPMNARVWTRLVRSFPLPCAIVLGLLASPALADYLVVNRRVTLRQAPIAGSDPEVQVNEGQVLPLHAQAKVNRYYQVEYPPDRISWVYQSFVTLHEGTPPEPGGDTALGPLEVYFLNVGQADAILLRCPHGEHEMLIDSGDNRYPGSSASFRRQFGLLQATDNPIEVVVATHPHADHIAGMQWVVERYRINAYIDSGMHSTSRTFTRLQEKLGARGVARAHVRDSVPDIDFCTLEGLRARILRPEGYGTLSDPNDWSVVVRVDYGDDSFLFVGDAEDHAEEQLLHDPLTRALIDCDLLKIGHHGSDTSSTAEFISAVTPAVAVISCGLPGVGTNSLYKHPRMTTIDTLLSHVRSQAPARPLAAYDAEAGKWAIRDLHGALYCTSLDGDLYFISRGDGIHRVTTP